MPGTSAPSPPAGSWIRATRFFADSFASLLAGVGLHADGVTLSLVLPIGISYYVFQNLSYNIGSVDGVTLLIAAVLYSIQI